MKKKIIAFCSITVLIMLAIIAPIMQTSALSQREAVFVNKVTFNSSGDNYEIFIGFDKSIGSEDKQLQVNDNILIGGKQLSTIEGSAVYLQSTSVFSNQTTALKVIVPITSGAVSSQGYSDVSLLSELEMQSDKTYVLTFDTTYRLGAKGAVSTKRIYRPQEKGSLKVMSVSSPSKTPEGNLKISVYFNNMISSRQLTDIQYWTKAYINALNPHQYSTVEMDKYFNFGILGSDNTESLLYKIMIGAYDYNNLTHHDSTTIIRQSEKYDFGTRDKDDDISLYTVKNLMHSTVSPTGDPGAAQQVVQIHISGNLMDIYLKGDHPQEQFNIYVDPTEYLVVCFDEGLLFPSGDMLADEQMFVWNPTDKKWINGLVDEDKTVYTDETLNNQGGI